jgi:hypothetical protein
MKSKLVKLSCGHELPESEILSEAARIQASKRTTHGAGTGRPREAERCPCGAMTKARATARNHKCK